MCCTVTAAIVSRHAEEVASLWLFWSNAIRSLHVKTGIMVTGTQDNYEVRSLFAERATFSGALLLGGVVALQLLKLLFKPIQAGKR